MSFKKSKTRENLMRAFAGESQARNRYTFAASEAKKQNLYVVEQVFLYTAKQELAHAKVFYQYLQECNGDNILVDGNYPVNIEKNVTNLLKAAAHNEMEEYEDVYANFSKIAREEGFDKIADSFSMIAKIEKTHGQRFQHFADLLEQGRLFKRDGELEWICLNCGQIIKEGEAPEVCPVCYHNQGYFIPLTDAPFGR